MPVLSIGDLAGTFQMRRLSAGLKSDLTQLGRELTTGFKSDLGTALAGDFGAFAGIERSLIALRAYKAANAEASSLFAAAQLSLENLQDLGRDLSPGLLIASNSRDRAMIAAAAEDARQKFDSSVARLNTQSADRTLFGGTATDRPALATADAMMTEIKLAVAGETTAVGVAAALDAWFDTPAGGFETSGYLGSGTDMGPLSIAEGETAIVDFKADDQTFRDMLKGFAMAGLIAEGTLDGDVDAQAELVSIAAGRLLTSDRHLTDLRARIGATESRIENAKARNSAEQTAFELARNELVAADPYETATRLEAVYSQIETLYTATARIAGLNFTDYMR